jgi:hypothetical protein
MFSPDVPLVPDVLIVAGLPDFDGVQVGVSAIAFIPSVAGVSAIAGVSSVAFILAVDGILAVVSFPANSGVLMLL